MKAPRSSGCSLKGEIAGPLASIAISCALTISGLIMPASISRSAATFEAGRPRVSLSASMPSGSVSMQVTISAAASGLSELREIANSIEGLR